MGNRPPLAAAAPIGEEAMSTRERRRAVERRAEALFKEHYPSLQRFEEQTQLRAHAPTPIAEHYRRLAAQQVAGEEDNRTPQRRWFAFDRWLRLIVWPIARLFRRPHGAQSKEL
jgi:hypothetical protein